MTVTLAKLKDHLNITTATHDAELTGKLDASLGWVARKTGIGGPTTFKVYATGRRLVLPVAGVASVVSVTDPDGVAVTLAAKDSNLVAGIIDVPYARSGPWTVTVTFPATSPDLDEAVLIIAGHLWDTQRGTAPTALQLQDPSAPDVGGFGAGYAIPNRAQDLLTSYILPGIA